MIRLIFRVVDEKCFPYTGKPEKCHIPRRGTLRSARCSPAANPDRKDKYRVAPAYRLGNETDIMYEIIHSGPVQGEFHKYFVQFETIKLNFSNNSSLPWFLLISKWHIQTFRIISNG